MATKGEEVLKSLYETIAKHPSERVSLEIKTVTFISVVIHGLDLAYITFEDCVFKDCAFFDAAPVHPEQFTNCRAVYTADHSKMFGQVWDREIIHRYCEVK